MVVEARLAVALREAAPVAPQLAQVKVPGAAGGAAGLELGAGIIMGNWKWLLDVNYSAELWCVFPLLTDLIIWHFVRAIQR